MMSFEIVGSITSIETIAVGSAILESDRLRQQFGRGRWRKLKGNGIGRRRMKIKKFLV